MSVTFLVIQLLIAGGVVAVIASCFIIVQQKTAAVIEFFGKFHAVKAAGLNVKPPYPLAKVAGTVNLQIRELREEVGVKSSDNAFLAVPVKVQYRVIEDAVEHAFYELANAEQQILSYIVNIVRSEASKMTMDALFQSKDAFETAVESGLNERFATYGYRIVNVLVDDPQPSSQLREAFDRVLAAQRERDAADNLAQAARIKMVGEAQAEADSLKLKAEAFSEFRRIIAEGNAEALRLFIKDTEGLTPQDVLRFFEGIDQRETIRDASRNPATLIVISTSPSADRTSNDAAVLPAIEQGLRRREAGTA